MDTPACDAKIRPLPVQKLFTQAPLNLKQGGMALMCRSQLKGMSCPTIFTDSHPCELSVGAFLGPGRHDPHLQVVGRQWLPGDMPPLQQEVATLQALAACAFDSEPTTCRAWLQGTSLAWITLSDAGHQGRREDESGPQIPKLLKAELDLSLDQGFVLPDDLASLKGLISHLALNQGVDLIVTTGGTGVTTRDITPEATLSLVERRLPGFEQAMLTASMAKTHHGLISRAVAGILHRTLIINLPGSPKAVAENLAPLLPALRHCLDKIHDDPRDCASS